MTDIDLIIPMVFPQDPVWQREYRKYKGGDDATQHVRFRSWGTEELLVRCVMKYMPWVRCIIILLASESQEQEWMRILAEKREAQVPEVRVVFHREFMPEELLPCFASPCIEMFLHRIPGLSERFIYGNDDMFPLSPLEVSDFFRPAGEAAGTVALLPCQHITERAYPAKPNVFERKCMWQQNMIAGPFGKHFTKTYPDTGHIFSAILKSSCEEVWRRHGDEITKYLSPLKRTDHSANNWIFQLYQQYAGMYVDHCPPRHYTDQGTRTERLAAIIADPKAGIVCINDNEGIKDWEQRASVVREAIERKLQTPPLTPPLGGRGVATAGEATGTAAGEAAGTAATFPTGKATGTAADDETAARGGIALCAIGRMENDYAREWVEHHLKVGFDHIIIADNNHDGEERFEDVLGDRIAEGRVTIEDFRNVEKAQRMAYNAIYQKYGKQYDWMAFFDFDEFLCLGDGLTSVKELLARHNGKADCVMVPWMMMTDSGLVRKDTRPLMERFTETAADYVCLGKGIIRGGIGGVKFTGSVHVPYHPVLRCVSPTGKPCRQHRQQEADYTVAYLKHFSTKTIEEWLTNKSRKGTAGRSYERFMETYRDFFFTINERTAEKEQFIKGYTREHTLTVATVHYNTPKLTRAAVMSLWKHTPGARVVIFDNSDKLTIAKSSAWNDLRSHPLVTIIDNTQGQVINWEKWLEHYPERNMADGSRFGSAKHCKSVDLLFDLLPDGFLLMESDVLVRRDVTPLFDRSVAAAGTVQKKRGIPLIRPYLCWLNVPMLREAGIRYFDDQHIWALTPGNYWDVGAWMLHEVREKGLPMTDTDIFEYILHLGHASWKGDKNPMAWIKEHQDLWL